MSETLLLHTVYHNINVNVNVWEKNGEERGLGQAQPLLYCGSPPGHALVLVPALVPNMYIVNVMDRISIYTVR